MTDRTGTTQDHVYIGKIIGEVIRELRHERGFSQEELGFESGLHRTYMSLLERGKRVPTLTTLTRLATALNILPSEIVRRVETSMGLTVKEKN